MDPLSIVAASLSRPKIYKASNNVKVSYPTESINTTQKNKLIYIWYATTRGEVKVSIDIKTGGAGTTPTAYVYACANSSTATGTSSVWTNSNLASAFPMDTTTPLGTESALDASIAPFDNGLVGSNTTTTYTTYTTTLRIQNPGPIFFVLSGRASAGAASLNCAAKNLIISYDLVG